MSYYNHLNKLYEFLTIINVYCEMQKKLNDIFMAIFLFHSLKVWACPGVVNFANLEKLNQFDYVPLNI